MADEQPPAEEGHTPDEDHALEVDMEYVEALPGGRAVMPIEREGRFVWLVVEGHVSPQARTEMIKDLNHIIRCGLWVQNWQPPHTE
ncbi:hypothetical protein [Streptomyces canus]|uniref:hypothetical protein n=1 Tax=Streptomyces canus TaxID=58343 RepID=UPI00386FC4FD|nr:hypothetical protein OH824_17625 [Streptomyces canus]